MKEILIFYLAAINLIGFILPFIDKKSAVDHSRRIPEKTLFIISILGGSPAMLLSMKLFRHKTKHKRFMIGIPVIITIQIILIFILKNSVR